MRDIKIISDSSCDLSNNLIKQYDLTIVPFLVSFDGEIYYKENIDITNAEFYKVLRSQDVYPKTSLPTIVNYCDEFKKYLNEDKDVICFTLTSKFSGSNQSAVNAAEIVNEEYGAPRVHVVDSIQATSAQGAIVLEAAKMKEAGLSADEIIRRIDIIKHNCIIYVTVDSLVYLQKGGRVGKAGALAGSLLNIKPLIVLKDGELNPLGKIRGRKRALSELIEYVKKDVGDRKEDYEFFLTSADSHDEMDEFTREIESKLKIKLSYEGFDVGVTIGAHIGPTAVALGYVKKYTAV